MKGSASQSQAIRACSPRLMVSRVLITAGSISRNACRARCLSLRRACMDPRSTDYLYTDQIRWQRKPNSDASTVDAPPLLNVSRCRDGHQLFFSDFLGHQTVYYVKWCHLFTTKTITTVHAFLVYKLHPSGWYHHYKSWLPTETCSTNVQYISRDFYCTQACTYTACCMHTRACLYKAASRCFSLLIERFKYFNPLHAPNSYSYLVSM